MAGPTIEQVAKQPSEHMQQVALCMFSQQCLLHHPDWFFMLEFMFAVPNGGKRGMVTASKLVNEGVKKGCPDLMLPFPCSGYHGLFIEMKTVKGGRVASEQRKFIDYLNSQNYLAIIGKGYLSAREQLLDYLGLSTFQLTF